MHHGNLMPLLLLIVSGTFATVLVFLVCEIGQKIGEAFDKIDFTLNKIDYYLLPIEIKRMLPIIIAIAQQPVELECFGSIICTRDVFKNVSFFYKESANN